MAKNKDPRYPNLHGWGLVTLTDGSAQTWVADSDSEGCYISSISVVTDADESGDYLTFKILNGSDTMVAHLGEWDMTANCGDDGVAPEDIKSKMAFLDVDGASNKQLFIPAGYKIQVQASGVSGTNIYVSIGYSEMAED